jgi:hypothetical protein
MDRDDLSTVSANWSVSMKHWIILSVCLVVLLAACKTPTTVIVTREVTREMVRQIEVTRVVVQSPGRTEGVPADIRYPTYTPFPTYTSFPTCTPYRISTSTPTLTVSPATEATPTPTSTATQMIPKAAVGPRATVTPAVVPAPAMIRRPDRDPGPPFSITVSANRAGPNSVYIVSGIVRNDGQETYEAIDVDATFWDDEGFRHASVDVRCPCVLLRPGEECPYMIETAMRRPVSFLLHPKGRPSGPGRESIPVELSHVQLIYDATDSARIVGMATNRQPFKAKNIVVAGVLLDTAQQIVAMGSTYVLQEDILLGGSVPFDLRVERASFQSYRLYAQAERDWQ